MLVEPSLAAPLKLLDLVQRRPPAQCLEHSQRKRKLKSMRLHLVHATLASRPLPKKPLLPAQTVKIMTFAFLAFVVESMVIIPPTNSSQSMKPRFSASIYEMPANLEEIKFIMLSATCVTRFVSPTF